jgi:hypothetical protein
VEYTRVMIREVTRITIPSEIGFMVNSIAEDRVSNVADIIISINMYRYDIIFENIIFCVGSLIL